MIVFGALFAAMQLFRYPRVNPPVRSDLDAPPEVEVVLRRACYECHSNETRWPWYSAVAPASWLVHYDVTEARRRLNFSEWADYEDDPGTRTQKLDEMAELISSGRMAPWYYRLMHREARLNAAERDVILRWIRRENSGSRQ